MHGARVAFADARIVRPVPRNEAFSVAVAVVEDRGAYAVQVICGGLSWMRPIPFELNVATARIRSGESCAGPDESATPREPNFGTGPMRLCIEVDRRHLVDEDLLGQALVHFEVLPATGFFNRIRRVWWARVPEDVRPSGTFDVRHGAVVHISVSR